MGDNVTCRRILSTVEIDTHARPPAVRIAIKTGGILFNICRNDVGVVLPSASRMRHHSIIRVQSVAGGWTTGERNVRWPFSASRLHTKLFKLELGAFMFLLSTLTYSPFVVIRCVPCRGLCMCVRECVLSYPCVCVCAHYL